MDCRCAERGYVRSLEEDDFGFPAKIEAMEETPSAMLGRCRACGTWWERLPHWVYGYAWYRTEEGWWAETPDSAVAAWSEKRQTVTA